MQFKFLKTTCLFVLGLFLYQCQPVNSSQENIPERKWQPADLVEPLVDAANSRWFFFNSATRPFGMVNLSPDMGISGAWASGYQYNRDSIKCFSHIHAWQLSGIPVLPTTGPFKGHLGSEYYGSRYDHDRETLRAGYHQITLEDYNINAELTSTTRVGFHRYTFPKSEESHIHIDFSTELGPCDTEKGYGKMVSNKEIEGYALMGSTRRRPKPVFVYYVMQFDQPFEKFGAWKDGNLLENVSSVEGPQTGVYVSFPTEQGEQRLMKVAISYVSIEQARINLETELPEWNFDLTVADSRNDWNRWLSKIEVEGGTEVEQRRFYTDLWHALQGRRIISDVNGKYCDMTGPERKIGQIPLDPSGKPLFNHYNSDSFWGAQWTLNTLWHLVYPKVTEEFVQSMLLMYQDGGLIPRGPSGGNYTFVMTGASTTPFIVSAYMKGIKGYDIEKAYEGMRKNHFPGGLMSKSGYEHNTATGGGLEYYIKNGYVPHPLPEPKQGFHEDGAAQTLEYAYQDWCLAQLALQLEKQEDYQLFMSRANNYRNLWNEQENCMWVKDLEGNWKEPVDILQYGQGWVEGNAAQYTWWVPHDVKGLANLIGGPDKFIQKLNLSFELAKEHDFVSAKSHEKGEQEAFRRRYLNYGNQPSIQTGFLFNYVGAPWLTQHWSREIVEKVYAGISPAFGYSGDEDQGLMGSLAVLLKIGLFSVSGGANTEPFYEIGSPIFDKITIHLDKNYYSDTSIIIETSENSSANRYIQEIKFNGQPLDKSWIYHKDLVKGGKIEMKMGPSPNKNWAADESTWPPSLSDKK